MLRLHLVVRGLLIALVSYLSPASAATLDPGKVHSVVSSDGKTVLCADVNGGSFYAKAAGKKFELAGDEIKRVRKAAKKAFGAKKKKLKKKIARLVAEQKLFDAVCKVGTQPTPSATATPTPTPPSASLNPLTRALTRDDVVYLLDKAGFGLSSREDYLVNIGMTQGVGALVDEFMRQKDEPGGLLARVEDRLDNQLGTTTTQSPAGQRAAILDLWINTNNPYSEKLALILLSIWTVAGDVIEDETFRHTFWSYYTRLRNYSAVETDIPTLGVEISRDPLMLIYLNNELNVKESPNENYARELMELFTLGPTNFDGKANYTETNLDGSGDIIVAAKMLTGWTVKKNYVVNQLQPQYVPNRHFNGPHTMFAGTSYAFSGETDEDLVRGIFAHHPHAKFYYAQELLKEYVTPNPPRALVEAFGNVIQSNSFKLRPSLATLFKSEAFFDASYRDTVPMNSLEFAAKTARMLGLFDAVNAGEGEQQLRLMGMQVNQAPSVFWYKQSSWVSSSVVLEKSNYLANILSDSTAQALPDPDWTPALTLPTGPLSLAELIEHVRTRTGLPALSAAQLSDLDGYLKVERQYNGTYTPFTYNNQNTTHQRQKGLGVYYLMFMSMKFQLL